jgi:hypothetical protein
MYCNPVVLGMDSGQIGGLLVVAGVLLASIQGCGNIFREDSSGRKQLIAEYIVTYIGVAIIFAVGLLVGRQGCY